MAEFIDYPKVDRFYRHYKGGIYHVLGMSKHSETNELLVIYESIEFGTLHARPLTSWNEPAEIDGSAAYARFVLLDDDEV